MEENETPCPTCRLLIPSGTKHESFSVCIHALQAAMLRQKRSAESIGYEVSVRFLAILEELALHPDAGVPYKMLAEGTQVEDVPPQQVGGIFAAILLRYRDVCDWAPLAEAREMARAATAELIMARGLLEEALKWDIPIALTKGIEAFLKQP
jgi:hypothetical protein